MSTSIDEDVFCVGIAEHRDGTGRSLIFQEPVMPSLIDEIESYCTVTEDHWAADGGIRRVRLRDQQLTLTFSPAAALELHLEGDEVILTLDVEASAVAELVEGLSPILVYGRQDQHPELLLTP